MCTDEFVTYEEYRDDALQLLINEYLKPFPKEEVIKFFWEQEPTLREDYDHRLKNKMSFYNGSWCYEMSYLF